MPTVGLSGAARCVRLIKCHKQMRPRLGASSSALAPHLHSCWYPQRRGFAAGRVEEVDALIVGGGIMGSSVALMMKILYPKWRILMLEQFNRVGAESSNEWRNAGTGHAALCEPNYTPMNKSTGEVEIDKAVGINQQFLVSLQWWTWLVEKGVLPDANFIQPAPHVTFVHTEEQVHWLKKRYEKLKQLPTFADMEYSEDYDTIKDWVPLLCSGRPKDGSRIAATRHPGGTECNYGLLTRNLAQSFTELGGELNLLSKVTALKQQADTSWLVDVEKDDLAKTSSKVHARMVFAACGGGTLKVLQDAGLSQVKGYAGMPVSGKFLVCQNPDIVQKHRDKVYAPAMAGAPPMSVPHLDWRTLYGQDCIFFGPFAGFKPTVFVNKAMIPNVLDWVRTLNPFNVIPFVKSGLGNIDLVAYLLKEVFASKDQQLSTLRSFVPDARPEDWTMIWAGQRIQTVHPNGQLMFGTEIVASEDNTLVGLLGASPGASVSPHIAMEVIERFHMADDEADTQYWHTSLANMIPSYGRAINEVPGLYEEIFKRADEVLFQTPPTSAQNINSMFRRLDTDASGSLSAEELRKHLLSQGLKDEAIDVIIRKLDTDKSGDICAHEFRDGFAHFITSQLTMGETSQPATRLRRQAPTVQDGPARKKAKTAEVLEAIDDVLESIDGVDGENWRRLVAIEEARVVKQGASESVSSTDFAENLALRPGGTKLMANDTTGRSATL